MLIAQRDENILEDGTDVGVEICLTVPSELLKDQDAGVSACLFLLVRLHHLKRSKDF